MKPFAKEFFPRTVGVPDTNFYCKYNDRVLQTFASIMHHRGIGSISCWLLHSQVWTHQVTVTKLCACTYSAQPWMHYMTQFGQPISSQHAAYCILVPVHATLS